MNIQLVSILAKNEFSYSWLDMTFIFVRCIPTGGIAWLGWVAVGYALIQLLIIKDSSHPYIHKYLQLS